MVTFTYKNRKKARAEGAAEPNKSFLVSAARSSSIDGNDIQKVRHVLTHPGLLHAPQKGVWKLTDTFLTSKFLPIVAPKKIASKTDFGRILGVPIRIGYQINRIKREECVQIAGGRNRFAAAPHPELP